MERERSSLPEVSELELRLLREPNDLASLQALQGFFRLFTAGCLEIREHWKPPLYRRVEGVDLELLSSEERIVAESAGSFHGECFGELLLKAARGIRRAIPQSRRKLTDEEAGAFASLHTPEPDAPPPEIEEALSYEPPTSSCSV